MTGLVELVRLVWRALSDIQDHVEPGLKEYVVAAKEALDPLIDAVAFAYLMEEPLPEEVE